jgi:ParB family chromosome partitioning protein
LAKKKKTQITSMVMQMSDLSNESVNKKQRLGRGLGSLLGESVGVTQQPPAAASDYRQTATPPESRVWSVAVDKLQASQYQPRVNFNKEALEELANSIKQHGILQPIVARRLDHQRFEIIAGERRWRAAQMAGLHEVPVILKTLKNLEALEIAIIENIQREDLNPIEEAEAYQKLVDEFHLTQQQVAEKVGKERATVANSLRLLNLAPAVRLMVAKMEISPGHAKVLLGVADQKQQILLAEQVRDKFLTVRQLEKSSLSSRPEKLVPNIGAKALDANLTQRLISGLSDELQKLLGTKVQIDYVNAKGKISIQFYSDEELTQIVERLKAGCRN